MTLPPRTPTMRGALEQIASLIQSLPRSATADQIHAVARAALAAEESGWRPISEAPRGDWLLLVYDGGEVSNSPGIKIWRASGSDINQFTRAGITHFRCLPPTPAAKEPSK